METSEDEMLGNELKEDQNQSVDYICQKCEKMEFEPGPVSSTDNFYNPILNGKIQPAPTIVQCATLSGSYLNSRILDFLLRIASIKCRTS